MFKHMWILRDVCEDFYQKYKKDLLKVEVFRLKCVFYFKDGIIETIVHPTINESNIVMCLLGVALIWIGLIGKNIF